MCPPTYRRARADPSPDPSRAAGRGRRAAVLGKTVKNRHNAIGPQPRGANPTQTTERPIEVVDAVADASLRMPTAAFEFIMR